MDFSGNQAINSIGIQTSNKLLVGTLSGDIFRTSDFGITWDGWEAAVPSTGITSFLKTNEGKLLVGTDGKGVYYLKADESGWMEISKGLSNQIVTSLTQHTNGNIFASTFGGGLFVSTNEGTSWETTGQKTGQLRKVAVTKDGLLYIVENNVGILSSTDFGISWSRILTAPVRGLFISKHGYVFTSLGYTDTTSSIYFSKNNGVSWVKSNTQTITSVISSFAEDSLG
ncbi:MAG TPA: hypothetical protein DCQ28_02835, partial [Bacteroidetes bacterium]|nr:hypothetical protein [Bacteroidota bacterium]